MSFQDLDEFFDDTLRLPIGGKTYVIQSPDAKTGLYIQGMMSFAAQVRAGLDVDAENVQALQLDDEEERGLHRRLLGDTYDEMMDDGVRWHRIQHAGQTTLFWVLRGKAFAEEYWNGAGTPKAETTDPASEKSESEDPPASPGSSNSPEPSPESTTPGPTYSPAGP